MCVYNNNPLTDRSPDERRETRGGAKVKPWRRRPQAPHNYRDDVSRLYTLQVQLAVR